MNVRAIGIIGMESVALLLVKSLTRLDHRG